MKARPTMITLGGDILTVVVRSELGQIFGMEGLLTYW